MQLVVYIVMAFVAMSCIVKLSFWRLWQRFVYSTALAAFTLWSERLAVLQSKTQLADYLANTTALENMAIIVTIESALSFGFVACWMRGAYNGGRAKGWSGKAFYWYPPLLMFPLAFYILTQVIFAFTGVGFMHSTLTVAALLWLLPPLLAELAKRLLPEDEFRAEVLLMLTCFLCVLGLVSTQNGKIIYIAHDTGVNATLLVAGIVLIVVLMLVGVVADKLKWKYFNNKT